MFEAPACQSPCSIVLTAFAAVSPSDVMARRRVGHRPRRGRGSKIAQGDRQDAKEKQAASDASVPVQIFVDRQGSHKKRKREPSIDDSHENASPDGLNVPVNPDLESKKKIRSSPATESNGAPQVFTAGRTSGNGQKGAEVTPTASKDVAIPLTESENEKLKAKKTRKVKKLRQRNSQSLQKIETEVETAKENDGIDLMDVSEGPDLENSKNHHIEEKRRRWVSSERLGEVSGEYWTWASAPTEKDVANALMVVEENKLIRVRCDLCNISTCGGKERDEHLETKKHCALENKRNLEIVLEPRRRPEPPETSVPQEEKPSEPQQMSKAARKKAKRLKKNDMPSVARCEPCERSFTSLDGYAKHCKSKSHKKGVRKSLGITADTSGLEADRDAVITPIEGRGINTEGAVGIVTKTAEDGLEAKTEIISKPHGPPAQPDAVEEKASNGQLVDKATRKKAKRVKGRCEPCGLKFKSVQQYQAHCELQTHEKAVAKSQGITADASGLETDQTAVITPFEGQSIKTGGAVGMLAKTAEDGLGTKTEIISQSYRPSSQHGRLEEKASEGKLVDKATGKIAKRLRRSARVVVARCEPCEHDYRSLERYQAHFGTQQHEKAVAKSRDIAPNDSGLTSDPVTVATTIEGHGIKAEGAVEIKPQQTTAAERKHTNTEDTVETKVERVLERRRQPVQPVFPKEKPAEAQPVDNATQEQSKRLDIVASVVVSRCKPCGRDFKNIGAYKSHCRSEKHQEVVAKLRDIPVDASGFAAGPAVVATLVDGQAIKIEGFVKTRPETTAVVEGNEINTEDAVESKTEVVVEGRRPSTRPVPLQEKGSERQPIDKAAEQKAKHVEMKGKVAVARCEPCSRDFKSLSGYKYHCNSAKHHAVVAKARDI